MRGLIAAALVACAMVAGVPSAAASPRALWVWDGPVDQAIDVAESDGFDVLFVYAPPGFDPAPYRDFVNRAASLGIEVYAMGGDPSWATDKRVWQDWVAEVEAAAIFDGAVADVEPYLLPEWSEPGSQQKLINKYLHRLNDARRQAVSIDLIAAVPFWWDLAEFDRRGESLVERVVDRSDGLVVMAYRDHAAGADGIIEHASAEVATASAAGKIAWIGVETGDAGLDKVTFAEEGRSYLAGELALVDAEFAGELAGVAVHHYGAWIVLPE